MYYLPLNNKHDRKGFDCGDQDLNHWLMRMARQHRKKGVSATYVAVSSETSEEILGFYAIAITELINERLPGDLRKNLPDKVPAFRLGRLAVARTFQGRGLGESLLFDAIDRTTRITVEVGGVGIVVDAKPTAIGFYQQYGFEQLADHPFKLFLPF